VQAECVFDQVNRQPRQREQWGGCSRTQLDVEVILWHLIRATQIRQIRMHDRHAYRTLLAGSLYLPQKIQGQVGIAGQAVMHAVRTLAPRH